MSKQIRLLNKTDLLVLVLFPASAIFLSLQFKTNYLSTILLFYGPLSLWLSLKSKDRIVKTIVFSLTFSLPLGIILGYLGTNNHAWFVPSSLFPRLLNLVPFEDILWFFSFIYTTIIFYEHFFNKANKKNPNKHLFYLMRLLFTLSVLFFIILFTKPTLFIFPYTYFFIGTIFVFIPLVTILFFFPRLLSGSAKTGFYFFVHGLLFEVTGLQLNLWTFPGNHFLGQIRFLNHSFPFEEFFFWILLGSVSVLCYYEFFDDDRK